MDQKEQKESIIKLGQLVKETGKLYSESLSNFEITSENISKILTLETDGDAIQWKLDDHFSQEKNIPYLALDRAKLVGKIDDILDRVAYAGRILKNFAKYVDPEFGEKIKSIATICQEITSKFADAVEVIYSSFDQALALSKEIELMRDKAVEYSFEFEADLIGAKDIDWRQYEASRHILVESMKVIRTTKDASEILEIMALKYD